MAPPNAILVLGMHRSGTSCLAAMLSAAGGVVPGEAVRNWDNARGHYEATALIRLNEDVLAHSGGHWLAPPEDVRWTPEHAAERDRLLATPGITIWKDPRTLLVLPFWQAAQGHRAVGIVRHPLTVARSLHAWRGIPVAEGLRLWLAHAGPLAACGAPVLVFDQPRERFVADVVDVAASLGLPGDAGRVAAAYAEELVHHGAGEGPMAEPSSLAECVTLYERLGGATTATGPTFPWGSVRAALDAVAAGRQEEADRHAREALGSGADPAAVIAPLAAAWLRAHQADSLLALLDSADLPSPLDGLLRGKAHLAARRPAEAARCLEAACAGPEPLYEARHLLPLALWDAGEREAAERALEGLLPVALYPFRLHARRAEWAWSRQDPEGAFEHLEAALASAPFRRHGRLLNRRAVWRQALGDEPGAAADLALARDRDPTFRTR